MFIVWMVRAKDNDMNRDSVKAYFRRVQRSLEEDLDLGEELFFLVSLQIKQVLKHRNLVLFAKTPNHLFLGEVKIWAQNQGRFFFFLFFSLFFLFLGVIKTTNAKNECMKEALAGKSDWKVRWGYPKTKVASEFAVISTAK